MSFVGFSAFEETTLSPTSRPGPPSLGDEDNGEMSRATKMCLKRDATTRLKGLQKLKSLTSSLIERKEEASLRWLGSWWGEHLGKICNEDDWRLRVAAMEAVSMLGSVARSKEIAPDLWIWSHDADVARALPVAAWTKIFPKPTARERHRVAIAERINALLSTDVQSSPRRTTYLAALSDLDDDDDDELADTTWRALRKKHVPETAAERKACYRLIAARRRFDDRPGLSRLVSKEEDPANASSFWEALVTLGQPSEVIAERVRIPGFAKGAADKIDDVLALAASPAAAEQAALAAVEASQALPAKYTLKLCTPALAQGSALAAIAIAKRDVELPDVSSEGASYDQDPALVEELLKGEADPALMAKRLPESTRPLLVAAAEQYLKDADGGDFSDSDRRAIAYLAAVSIEPDVDSLEQWWRRCETTDAASLERLVGMAKGVDGAESRLARLSLDSSEKLAALRGAHLDDETRKVVDETLNSYHDRYGKHLPFLACLASSQALKEVNGKAISAFAQNDVSYFSVQNPWLVSDQCRRLEIRAAHLRACLVLEKDLPNDCTQDELDSFTLDLDDEYFARTAVALLNTYDRVKAAPPDLFSNKSSEILLEALDLALEEEARYERPLTSLVRSTPFLRWAAVDPSRTVELASRLMSESSEGPSLLVKAIEKALLCGEEAIAEELAEVRFGKLPSEQTVIVDDSAPLAAGDTVWYRGEQRCKVVAVHVDQGGDDFYTIKLDGADEKQTVRGRLSVCRDDEGIRPPAVVDDENVAILRSLFSTVSTPPAVRVLASRFVECGEAVALEADCEDGETIAAWFAVISLRKQPLPAATRDRARLRLMSFKNSDDDRVDPVWLEAAISYRAVSPSLEPEARLALDATLRGLPAKEWLPCAAALLRGPAFDAAVPVAGEATAIFVAALAEIGKSESAIAVTLDLLSRRDRNKVRLLDEASREIAARSDALVALLERDDDAGLAALDILLASPSLNSILPDTSRPSRMAFLLALERKDVRDVQFGLERALRDWNLGGEPYFVASGKRQPRLKVLDVESYDRPYAFVADHRPGKNKSIEHDAALIGAWTGYRTACLLPGPCRDWFATSGRSLGETARRLLEDTLKGAAVSRSLKKIGSTTLSGDESDVDVTVSVTGRHVAAIYRRDECAIEMKINYAACHPLRSVSVDLGSHQGVAEATGRRWALQLRACADHDSAIAAVDQWRASLDLEFKDVEPCPICCGVLNPSSKRLPDVQCSTCSNTFHSSCLEKWFTKSNKNTCVICQQPFVAIKVSSAKKRLARASRQADDAETVDEAAPIVDQSSATTQAFTDNGPAARSADDDDELD